ncbi:MAG: addiction module protein [Tepidisphaeraceae bacterium]
MTLDNLIDEVRKLSPADQAELLDELVCMVDPAIADLTLTPAQRVDLNRRIEEFRSGKAVMIDGDEAFARLRNRR